MATEKRLIDARYLTSQMYLICEICQTENIFIDAIIDEIDNAPDVDAVEVVRCEDCRRWKRTGDCRHGICYLDGAELFKWQHDFCSNRERKDNG